MKLVKENYKMLMDMVKERDPKRHQKLLEEISNAYGEVIELVSSYDPELAENFINSGGPKALLASIKKAFESK